MTNAFEVLGTAKRDIKAGDTICIRITGEGLMSADITLNRNMPILTPAGKTTLGEVLKKTSNE